MCGGLRERASVQPASVSLWSLQIYLVVGAEGLGRHPFAFMHPESSGLMTWELSVAEPADSEAWW